MTHIKIELPSNDPVALKAFSGALLEMSVAHGGEQPVKTVEPVEVEAIVTPSSSLAGVEMELSGNGDIPPEALIDNGQTVVTPPTLDELAVSDMDNALAATTNIVTPPVVTEPPVIPWDGRIHSKNKTTNADGSFKMRKKPADQTKEQWTSYIEAVKVELTELMNPTTQLEGVTPNGDVVIDSQDPSAVFGAAVTETPPVVVTPPVVTETPPVVVTPPVVTETPPVVVTPPVVTETPPVVVEADTPKTFGDLMKFVTTNKVKLTPDACQEVLTAHGVAKWPLLAVKLGAQPEFMNTIYPALKALL